LKNVTLEAPDFKTLELFWALRRLYVPSKETLDASTKQQLARGFAEGYEKFKDNPRVKDLVRLVQMYTGKLKQYGLRDYMVAKRMKAAVEAGEQTLVDRTELLLILVKRLGLLLFWSLIWVPAGVLSLPFLLLTRYVAWNKAAEAVAKSHARIAGSRGRDVVATWKVLVAIGLWPSMHIVYTTLMMMLFGTTYAVWYFFFMPFISFANLKAQGNMIRLFKSIAPVTLMLRRRDLAEALVLLREKCREETTAIVDEVGWGVRMRFQTRDKSLPLEVFLQREHSFSDMFITNDTLGSNPASPVHQRES